MTSDAGRVAKRDVLLRSSKLALRPHLHYPPLIIWYTVVLFHSEVTPLRLPEQYNVALA